MAVLKDSRLVNVHVVASMTAERLQDFLQNLRDFDMKHDSEIPFQIVANCPTMTSEEIESIYKSIKPPMPFHGTVKFGGQLWDPEDKAS